VSQEKEKTPAKLMRNLPGRAVELISTDACSYRGEAWLLQATNYLAEWQATWRLSNCRNNGSSALHRSAANQCTSVSL